MSDLRPEDLEDFDPDLELARLNQWRAMGGDETGPPEVWGAVLDLMSDAFEMLAEDLTLDEALLTFAEAYAAILAHHLAK